MVGIMHLRRTENEKEDNVPSGTANDEEHTAVRGRGAQALAFLTQKGILQLVGGWSEDGPASDTQHQQQQQGKELPKACFMHCIFSIFSLFFISCLFICFFEFHLS